MDYLHYDLKERYIGKKLIGLLQYKAILPVIEFEKLLGGEGYVIITGVGELCAF